ncbi:Golgi-associated plant pathogenesis-related protein 1-like [Anopheles ziemanni]|uniref:Golgi-associated plant pathogenesis-related protein 1-like n=1 Tax=Anopheles coustani TaxID=139045 RepID=UPI002657FCE9|nr:Golgi-associated plant pathogenesis-related protein 1-like [Anopheles coustani]XP_058168875.1 Golgi-associated plant pathogenesis-related protein 1-like [Anopheles ziemanni]
MSYTAFQQQVLQRHNELRAKHSAAPLVLDPAICQYAQEWANTLASRNVMQHRTNGKYGENLFAQFGNTNVTASQAVDSWYNEIKYYQFGASQPHNFSQVGHFTALVWKNSRRLGVGIASRGSNVYVVCNYDPAGNFMGQYHLNVSRN